MTSRTSMHMLPIFNYQKEGYYVSEKNHQNDYPSHIELFSLKTIKHAKTKKRGKNI